MAIFEIIDKPENMLENMHIISIGNPEKAKNKQLVAVNLPNTKTIYRFFNAGKTAGGNALLIKTLRALGVLFSGSKKDTEKAYKTIVESLHIVHHISSAKRHSKLDNINSLSACCLDNYLCLCRMACEKSICPHCYARTQQAIQYGLTEHNIVNGIILRNIVIPVKYWKKYINPYHISKYFRIESFGDVQNETQVKNYINFMLAFPRVHFAAWTKNKNIWLRVFDQMGKPANLSFVVSSNVVNKPVIVTDPRIDHVFTVYDERFITENNVNINCGGRSCKECIKQGKACYFAGKDPVINEQLK